MVPYECLLAHFEDTFDFSRREYTAHDNLWLCYYVQVNSLQLKWSVAS